MNKNREFETGANRNSDEGKLDYSGFNHPLVEWAFAQYMHTHRELEDGTLRDSDNWQKGIPNNELLKSKRRHDQDYDMIARGIKVTENGEELDPVEVLCGIRFNINALILSYVKQIEEVDRNFEE